MNIQFKPIVVLSTILISSLVYSQNINDGLRYSTDYTTGSARFQALSGAFGALGGDLSAISLNPASSAVFIQNEAGVSFSLDDLNNSSTYFNSSRGSIDTDVSINQAGGVFIFDDFQEDSPWRKVTLGINYNLTRNHDNEIFIQGSGNNSVGSFFTEQAQGVSLDLLQLQAGEDVSSLYRFLGETQGVSAQNAFLGFQGFLFDPLENQPNNTTYLPNYAGNSFNQDYILATGGHTGKYTFNIGAQYKDDFFFGLNLNSHSIDYQETSFIRETNTNASSSISRIEFENNLAAQGIGFSAQIGIISRIADNFRIGLTYDTPTWFVISEETTQFLETRRVENGQTLSEVVNPFVINLYEDYNLRTPGRIGASAAYIFGSQGLVSFDYAYKDYSNITFSPKDISAFEVANNFIDATLQGASSFKIGGEYRIKQLSLRGGAMFEESPYIDNEILGDRQGFSLGIGYNFGNYNFDIAYSRAEQDRRQQLYSIGLTDTAQINTVTSVVVLTLGIKI